MTKSFLKYIFAVAVSTVSLVAHAYASGEIAGPDNAPITIEEYVDFECPYCARGAATVSQLMKDYPGKIKLRVRNLPLPAHPNSLAAAKAFTAIGLQSKELAYAYQEKLFKNQSRLGKEGSRYLYELAKTIGADADRMKMDMESQTVARIIEDDQKQAEVLNIKGTPSFMVGNELIIGAYPIEHFKKSIDRQLAQ